MTLRIAVPNKGALSQAATDIHNRCSRMAEEA